MNVRIVKILLYKTWKKRLKRVLESVSEVAIEVCIDEWVEGRVEISDPEQDSDQNVWTRTQIGATERRYHIP